MEGVNYVISAVLVTAMMIWLVVGAIKCWKRKDHCSMGAILTIAGEVALFPGWIIYFVYFCGKGESG